MSYIHPKYNGRVGLYNHGIEQCITGLGWPGASLHLDASLPTSTSVVYGYNTTSGSNLIRMSNLADNTSNTDAIGSAKLGGSGTTSNVYINVPSTPLYGGGYGLSSSITYNTSSTYSTLFLVSTNYIPYNIGNNITSYNSNTCQWISECPSFIFQSNAGSEALITGAHTKIPVAGTKYLTTLRGSNTSAANTTTIKSNGATWSFDGGYQSGKGSLNKTELLAYYITDHAPDSRGVTTSISEMIYFDYLLSDNEFNRVEAYLKNKWGLTY